MCHNGELCRFINHTIELNPEFSIIINDIIHAICVNHPVDKIIQLGEIRHLLFHSLLTSSNCGICI